MRRSEKEKHAKRRLSKRHMQAKAKRIARINGVSPEKFVRIADHMQVCSGPCCGNRRRYEGRGLDEIRHLDSMREAILPEMPGITTE